MTLPLETIISMWKDHDADIEYQLPDGSWEYVEYPDFNSTKVFRIYMGPDFNKVRWHAVEGKGGISDGFPSREEALSSSNPPPRHLLKVVVDYQGFLVTTTLEEI